MKSEIFILFFAFISPIKAFFPSTKAIVPAGSQYKRGSRCHLHLRILSSQVQNVAPTAKSIFPETLFMQYSKKAQNSLMASPLISFLTSYWLIVPALLRHILKAMHPADFIFLGLFNLLYKKTLRLAHASQTWAFKVMKRSPPLEYDKSILGFVEKRSHLFVQLLAFNYIIKLSCSLLIELGLRIRPDFASILSRLSHLFYCGNFLDLFKSKFVHIFLPSLTEDRRKNYVFNRSVSVALWFVIFLIACEMVSTYLKVPLSSTLAFGGVGGVALGLSAKDVMGNYLGGMMLLFNEPFTPGDMVTFRVGSNELIGRVERVGWGQTRIRGRDTRPTYVPNSQFTQLAVTNMDRITHRKFEAKIPIRFQDQQLMPEILSRIRDTLRTIPKLDTLSMPYRVHFVGFGQFSLDIEIICYFATKSVDEFLSLQQVANIEILKAINSCGAQLALPTTVMMSVTGTSSDAVFATTGSPVVAVASSPQDSVSSSLTPTAAISSPPPPNADSSVQPSVTVSNPQFSANVTPTLASATLPMIQPSLPLPPILKPVADPAPVVATLDLNSIARASQVLSTNAPAMRASSSPDLSSTNSANTSVINSLNSHSLASGSTSSSTTNSKSGSTSTSSVAYSPPSSHISPDTSAVVVQKKKSYAPTSFKRPKSAIVDMNIKDLNAD